MLLKFSDLLLEDDDFRSKIIAKENFEKEEALELENEKSMIDALNEKPIV
jgi:hypothetical protein